MSGAGSSDNHDRVIDLVKKFHEKFGLDETFRRLIAFMVSYVSLMKNSLPDAAREALAVSERVGAGAGTDEDAVSARNSCWNYLKSIGSEYDFDSREACAVRAVLCTLITDPRQNDLSHITHWFLRFADTVEDHSSEMKGLFDEHFG
jgi:hypothetical protein